MKSLKTEHLWLTISVILEVYSIVKADVVFIGVNWGFIVFNLYQLLKKKNIITSTISFFPDECLEDIGEA